jgi:xanthine dehydrogenase molybdopterin-binding subunit B
VVRRHDPLDRRARDVRRAGARPAFDWTKVVVVTADDIPGDNIVSSIKNDQPILVPVGGEILHHAEPLALIAAPDKATLREARRRAVPRTSKLPAVFDPDVSDHVFAAYAIDRGDPDAAFAAAELILEGEYHVGHQEQLYIENNAMIAVPTEGGGVTVTGSLQCPYYVHSRLKKGLGSRMTRRGWSRPRRAVGSAGRRSSRRSSRSMRRCSRAKHRSPCG